MAKELKKLVSIVVMCGITEIIIKHSKILSNIDYRISSGLIIAFGFIAIEKLVITELRKDVN